VNAEASLGAPALRAARATPSLEAVFERQQATALAWRRSTAAERRARLRRLQRVLLAHRAALFEAMRADLGKPEVEVQTTELLPLLSEIRAARRHLGRWMAPRKVRPTALMLGTSSRIQPEPRGRSLIIAPWNYPLSLSLGPLVSALAAGCPAIVKPSEVAPQVTGVVARIVAEAFEPDEVAVFEGDAAVSTQLLALPFDHIFFTGSPRVGRIVMTAAARHLASVTLELGGKSPTIVDASSDIEAAARVIAWAKFTNCGQTCVAPDHVVVHESVRDAFVAALKQATNELYGAGIEQQKNGGALGRIVSAPHLARLRDLVQQAQQCGARLLYGGGIDAAARFMQPTLLDVDGVEAAHADRRGAGAPGRAAGAAGAVSQLRLMDEEIFGPVLPIQTYRDLDAVIAAINQRPKPLALYFWSRTPAAIDAVLRGTSSGGACINHCMIQFAHGNLPFGGVGASGFGRAHGIFGFEAFSHMKPVLSARLIVGKPFFPPYTAARRRLINVVMKLLGG
jgi:aldehyde dehydrogenase (NAD+)